MISWLSADSEAEASELLGSHKDMIYFNNSCITETYTNVRKMGNTIEKNNTGKHTVRSDDKAEWM